MLHRAAVLENGTRAQNVPFFFFRGAAGFPVVSFVVSTKGMRLVARGRARVCETRPAALPSNCRAREEPSTGRRRPLTLDGEKSPGCGSGCFCSASEL